MLSWRLDPYPIQWLYQTPQQKREIIKMLDKETFDFIKGLHENLNAQLLELKLEKDNE